MIDLLRDSIRNTLNKVDGYVIGRTVVEDGKGFIQLENGEIKRLTTEDKIQVISGEEYVSVSYEDLVEKKTEQGWPLFAGFDCRVK